ncbi:nucleotidyltransferase domain-containing protein [Candidatus Sumerlaeota bacterium]|nr:nucleotidyltransferase domain-containing protein [Candidatus Sumerlaeota bacterium]
MDATVEAKRMELEALCLTHRVHRLEIFGSAADGTFDAARSDLDFLVVFEEATPVEHAERYLGLLAGLQDLFGCAVDLVELKAIRNPHFRRGIESSRTLLYAA